jgi:hypothetical protein
MRPDDVGSRTVHQIPIVDPVPVGRLQKSLTIRQAKLPKLPGKLPNGIFRASLVFPSNQLTIPAIRNTVPFKNAICIQYGP